MIALFRSLELHRCRSPQDSITNSSKDISNSNSNSNHHSSSNPHSNHTGCPQACINLQACAPPAHPEYPCTTKGLPVCPSPVVHLGCRRLQALLVSLSPLLLRRGVVLDLRAWHHLPVCRTPTWLGEHWGVVVRLPRPVMWESPPTNGVRQRLPSFQSPRLGWHLSALCCCLYGGGSSHNMHICGSAVHSGASRPVEATGAVSGLLVPHAALSPSPWF